MNIRQGKLLVAIIEQFISTAEPVGSLNLLTSRDFKVSCATLRNEMRLLCDEGFLDQPHVSAGRVPTALGYRAYVQQFMQPSVHERKVRQKFEMLKDHYFKRKDQERVYEAVALLAQMVPDVAFATVPWKPNVYFLGLSHALRQPEFTANPALASGVVEVLEERLAGVLRKVKVDDKVRYYIGDEHLLPQIQSCSMMVTEYAVRDERGAIGILGHMRMDYSYNTVTLDLVASLLRSA